MKSLVKIAALSLTALTPLSAWAQEAAVPGEAAGAADVGEIIVTARKREENLQQVPVAITAFTDEDIKEARIESLADVAKLTPGLNYTPLFGAQNQLPIIRGAAQTFGALNVGVFLDGIYLSGKAGVDLELNDLQRVEVIKGPQSALYGRNTFAGAINYVTKRPAREWGGSVEGTAGTRGLFKGIGSISGPVSETLRVRLGGYYKEHNGFYRSAIDGGRVDFAQSYGGIATVEWQPVEELIATFRLSYVKDDNGQPPSSVIRNNGAPGTPAGGSATQPRNLLFRGELPSIPRNGVFVNTVTAPGQPSPYGDREEIWRGSATFEYDFGDVIGTSITSYSKRNAEYTFDGDNTICNFAAAPSTGCPNFGFPFAPAIPFGASRFALSSNDGYSEDYSQELRFTSSGKQTIDWLFGLFYYHNKNFGVDRGFAAFPTSGPTAYSGFNPNYPFPRSNVDTKSYAVFGSATWNATDRFAITGELRYEYEKQRFTQCPTFVANPAPVLPANPTPAQIATQNAAIAVRNASIACGATPSPIAISATTPFTASSSIFDLEQDFRFVTPRVIVNYQAMDDLLVYASYSRGAKTGGFNTGLNVFADQRAYDPEYSNNYEIGFKSNFMDRRGRFNASGFYIDWNDQQAACQNPITAGGSSTNRTYVCNVAASTIYGLELDAAVQFGIFSLAANYTWTHARYDEFVDDSLAQTLIAAGLPPVDFDGKRLPYVPDHKIVVSPQVDFPLGDDLSLTARADLSYQTKTYVRADNFQNFGDKTLLDLRLGLNAGAFGLQLFANNVLDNKRPVAGVRFFDSVNYSVSSPLVTGAQRRQLGATVRYRF